MPEEDQMESTKKLKITELVEDQITLDESEGMAVLFQKLEDLDGDFRRINFHKRVTGIKTKLIAGLLVLTGLMIPLMLILLANDIGSPFLLTPFTPVLAYVVVCYDKIRETLNIDLPSSNDILWYIITRNQDISVVSEIQTLVDFIEAAPLKHLQKSGQVDYATILLRLLSKCQEYITQIESNWRTVEGVERANASLTRVASRLGNVLLEHGEYETALDSYEITRQATTSSDDLPDIEQNIVDCHVGLVNRQLRAANRAAENGNHAAAIEEFQSAIDQAQQSDIEDELLSDLMDRARLGRANELLQLTNEEFEDATETLEAGEYETAIDRYETILNSIESASVSDDEVVQEPRTKLMQLRDRAQQGKLEAKIQQGRLMIEKASDLFGQEAYEDAEQQFESALDFFEALNPPTMDDRISDAVETARRGQVRSRTELLRKRLDDATNILESEDYRQARNRFTEIYDDLEEYLSSVDEHNLSDEVETLESLLADCEAGIESARRGLADVGSSDFELDVSMPADDDIGITPEPELLEEGEISRVDIDVELPEVNSELSRSAESLVEPELLTQLPKRDEMELIGQGGNAQVFKLTPDDGDEPVAVKVPLWKGDKTLDNTAMEEFIHEAKIWNELDDNTHVVNIHDIGTEPYPWIQMEYMDAGSLADYVGDIDIQDAVRLLSDLCETMYEAHTSSIVHADLKPSNILFRTTADGEEQLKIADWGTAKVLLNHSTGIGEYTPEYAAPEQVDPNQYGSVDKNTDIYQLGVVAYELLTGRVPFNYDETPAILRAIGNKEPTPPTSVKSGLPPGINDAVMKALNKKKEDRHEAVLYFRDQLQEAIAHDSSQ